VTLGSIKVDSNVDEIGLRGVLDYRRARRVGKQDERLMPRSSPRSNQLKSQAADLSLRGDPRLDLAETVSAACEKIPPPRRRPTAPFAVIAETPVSKRHEFRYPVERYSVWKPVVWREIQKHFR
jgi:hypothetical protein